MTMITRRKNHVSPSKNQALCHLGRAIYLARVKELLQFKNLTLCYQPSDAQKIGSSNALFIWCISSICFSLHACFHRDARKSEV